MDYFFSSRIEGKVSKEGYMRQDLSSTLDSGVRTGNMGNLKSQCLTRPLAPWSIHIL